jgi:DNA-binding transcriptional LysR family regulator
MADTNHKLQRIVPPIDDAASILWLLTHEDLRHTARVRPFMDFMADALKADIDLLEGRVRKLALTGAQKT